MVNFNKQIQAQFNKMAETDKLFRVALTGDQVWDIYLKSFAYLNDPVFRDPSSSVHNCNHCNNFIRRYGNIVAIDEQGNLMSMFDITPDVEYLDSAKAISKAIKNSNIENVFFETFNELKYLPYESCNKNQQSFRLGIDKNVKRYTKEEAELYGVVKPNEVRTFNHFHLNLDSKFVDQSGKSVEAVMAQYRDKCNVFKRAMIEITLNTFKLVEDLIEQGSLLDGTSHLHAIKKMKAYKLAYDSPVNDNENKDNYFWSITYNMDEATAKFNNTLIGVLCSEIEKGLDLNTVCMNWNKRVDPTNYMKATAPITKKQIQEAEKFIRDNDYAASFDRRFATIYDIEVSEIKHVNIGNGTIKTFSMFDSVKPTKSNAKMNFDHVKEISIEDFMTTILPDSQSVEAYLEGRMNNNMVTMTTANDKSSKQAFKWNNNYSWTFNGNLAGKSMLKEAVKDAGGKVDGVLRFSISWNEDGRSICDFDAHCLEPNKYRVYYGQKTGMLSGSLDVDMIRPSKMGVENIIYTDKSRMIDGEYTFIINNYDSGKNTGFKAQIEFDGQTFDYEVIGDIKNKTIIAVVKLEKGVFSIENKLPHSTSSKEIYGLDSNQFHKVNLVSLSPNHWGDNQVGNKHYFFMLEGCKTKDSIRSFHIENLNQELADHRKVMEVVGNANMIKAEGDQLSGLGFNATVRDNLIVKVDNKQLMKINFLM